MSPISWLCPLVLLGLFMGPAAAQSLAPAGGGGYQPPTGECVSAAQRVQIDSMLAANIRALRRRGVLPPAPAPRPATVPLSWPLRQAAGFGYNSIYSVANFVDLNSAYPNQLLDYNCGTRTYDTAGGANHAGIDIVLWPFDINMMARQQAEIVAAAPGTIVGRYDGNPDLSCAFSTAAWNAVFVLNADNSICWYGHMKNGSLTPKAVGAPVALGEFLGNVGSSGNSTGPHLHFEVHGPSPANNIIDPYYGPCSAAGSATSWASQKPYYEPTLNTLMTHSAPPVFSTCPAPHVINAVSNFAPGALGCFAAYYHDQQAGQATTYTIYRPNNTVFATWSHSSPQAWYQASYWFWSYTMPTVATPGTWRFTAAYQGTTTTQNFTVGTATATAAAQTAALALYPNPASRQVTVELSAAPLPGATAVLRNALGQVVARQPLAARQAVLALPAAAGLYLLTLPTAEGPVTRKLVVE